MIEYRVILKRKQIKENEIMAKYTKQQAEEQVYQLTEKLIKLRLDAKDTMAGYKEKMKDIESEIKAVIEEQNT